MCPARIYRCDSGLEDESVQCSIVHSSTTHLNKQTEIKIISSLLKVYLIKRNLTCHSIPVCILYSYLYHSAPE